MTANDDPLLTAYALGELGPRDRATVERRLAADPEARAFVEDVRETSGEMHSSELILGRWLRARGCRDEVTVCTKVSTGNRPENIARAVRDSRERLAVDTIDHFMLHTPDETVPVEESLDALNREVTAGRVASIGCSNHSGAKLREALEASRRLGVARFEAIENLYNMAHVEAEEG